MLCVRPYSRSLTWTDNRGHNFHRCCGAYVYTVNGSSFEYKIESPKPKDALCQVCLKLAQWFWRRRFLNFVNVFSLFRNYLPLEKGGALHLNKVESPSLKDALCKVWLKFVQWFWRKIFLNFVNVFSLYRNYLPLEKNGALHLKILKSPSPKDALCLVWLKLAQWFWKKIFKFRQCIFTIS